MTRKCFRKLTKAKILGDAFLDLKRKPEKGSNGGSIRYGKSLAISYLPIEETLSFVCVGKTKKLLYFTM